MSYLIRDKRLAFGILPVTLLERTALSPLARLLWAVLDSFGERIYPSQKVIAFRMGLKPENHRSVVRYVGELVAGGFLSVERGAAGGSNLYILTLPDYCFVNDPALLKIALDGSTAAPAPDLGPGPVGGKKRLRMTPRARIEWLEDRRRARIGSQATAANGSPPPPGPLDISLLSCYERRRR